MSQVVDEKELFPERRIIIRRPASGICQFCVKAISASNWSRHLRSQHMKELIRMRRGESPVNSEEQASEKLKQELEDPQLQPKQLKNEEEKNASSHESEVIDSGNQKRRIMVRRGKRKVGITDSDDKQKQTMGGRTVKRNITRSIIKLPRSNVCPICGRSTSAGNWSRHLKRHHPEYATDAQELNTLQGDNAQNEAMQQNDTTDFSLVHLQQFLAQQKQHHDFGAYAFDAVGEDEEEQLLGVELKMEDQIHAEEGVMQTEGTMTPKIEEGDEMEGTSARAATIHQQSDGVLLMANTRSRVQRRPSAIRPDKEGCCPLCGKHISSPNWRRHLLRCHPEEELLAQYTHPDPLFVIPLPTRLFALYAATAPMPTEHLENEFLKRFLSIVPEFEIPSRMMLQAQMDGEVERLKQRLRTELDSISGQQQVSISAFVGPPCPIERQQNWLALCAHFWDATANNTVLVAVGIGLCPVGYSNTDIVECVRERLTEMELGGGEQQRIIHLVVDRCSAFEREVKPAFFDPFPYIGGGLHSAISALGLPSEWTLADSSLERLEAFFNKESDEMGVPNGLERDCFMTADLDFDGATNVSACASRRLSSALREVLESDPCMLQLRKRVFALLEQFAFSHSACTALHARSGGMLLLFPADTSWMSLECAYARLLSLSSSLVPTCAEFKFVPIEEQDWTTLEKALEVADTFNKFIAKLEQCEQPSISLLFPGLLHLLATLQNFTQIPSITSSLIERVKHNFSDVFHSGSQDDRFPLFLCASMLDPTVAYLLQEQRQRGIAAVRAVVKKFVADPNALSRPPSVEAADIVVSPFGFGTVRRARMSLLGTGGGETAAGTSDQLDAEIIEYLALVQLDAAETATGFWAKHEQKFPLLSRTAKSVLAIPATGGVARQFLKRIQLDNCGGPEVATRRAFLTFNRRFVDLIE